MRVWCSKFLLAFFLVAANAWSLPVLLCGEGFGGIAHGDLSDLKRNNLQSTTHHADNEKFIDVVTGADAERYKLFFHIDNAVLKSLNDHYFKDQELSAAVESLFTKIFFRNLREDGALKPHLVYSDYKTIRLGFTHDTPQIRRRLEKVYEKTAADFREALEKFPNLRPLHADPGKRVDDAAAWHLGGWGRTADEAATATRLAREDFTPGKITPVHDFRDPKNYEELAKRVRHTEDLRKRVVGLADKKILSPGVGGQDVLSREAVELLRKVPGTSDADDVAYLRQRFQARFGLDLSAKPGLAEAMLAYYRAADTFAPAIYEKREIVDLGMGRAKNGAVRVDIAGQNARNLNELMGALAQATFECPGNCLAERAVYLARVGQTRASQNFDRRRKLFRDSVTASGIKGDTSMWADNGLQFSGDDGIFMPAAELSAAEKYTLMREVAKRGSGEFRVTFLPPQYASGGDIPARQRAAYVGEGESIEKNLRQRLEAAGYGRAELKKLAIGVDLLPSTNGGAEVNLILAGTVDAARAERVRQALDHVLPEKFTAGRIISP